ncbi:PP0621 family protein [Nitrogeniibacter aestuarii]|uniref:PP0621 family protein n=1 Tax=Nitrogeniibacter aestuarii TaxID=2815343 RepID=UPI001D1286F2|nr:PP0621 family protein [Nitrogeniibacter aestuarii]
MLKLLVFVLVLAAIFWGRRLISQMGKASRPRASSKQAPNAERMLACHRCGLHVPESEGVTQREHFYCCDAHARGQDD